VRLWEKEDYRKEVLVLPATTKREMNDKELRERIAAVLRDNHGRQAVNKIMAIIKPMRDRVIELKELLEIERAGRKDKQCPF
jgi:hypothetical protein